MVLDFCRFKTTVKRKHNIMRERIHNECGAANGEHAAKIQNILKVCLAQIDQHVEENNVDINDTMAWMTFIITNHFSCRLIMAADKERKKNKIS